MAGRPRVRNKERETGIKDLKYMTDDAKLMLMIFYLLIIFMGIFFGSIAYKYGKLNKSFYLVWWHEIKPRTEKKWLFVTLYSAIACTFIVTGFIGFLKFYFNF
jgi:hypothetical protein